LPDSVRNAIEQNGFRKFFAIMCCAKVWLTST